MIKIDVFVKDKNWKRYLPNPRRYLNNQAKKINLRNYLNPKSINISVLLTGNNGIRILNRKFRKKNKTTDILSFPNYNLREDKLIKVLKNKAQSLRIFNHKTEYLKNLNQMITTDWIPEFYIKKQ